MPAFYNGNLSDEETRVLESLKSTKFRRRTIRGISIESALSEADVQSALKKLESKRLARSVTGRRPYWVINNSY